MSSRAWRGAMNSELAPETEPTKEEEAGAKRRIIIPKYLKDYVVK